MKEIRYYKLITGSKYLCSDNPQKAQGVLIRSVIDDTILGYAREELEGFKEYKAIAEKLGWVFTDKDILTGYFWNGKWDESPEAQNEIDNFFSYSDVIEDNLESITAKEAKEIVEKQSAA